MSGTPLDLLRAITRDPDYVRRMQESDSSGVSKSWDNRFTVARMPEYDAVNDRFCKFNLRRRQGQGKDLPAPKRSKLAAQMLINRGPKPVWGDLSREPLPRTNLSPLPRPTPDRLQPSPLGLPEAQLPFQRAGHRPPATAPQGAAPGQDRLAQTGAFSQGSMTGQSVESLFSRGKQRLVKLWDELGVGEAERLQFAQQAMAVPTADNVQLINEEIQRLLDRRAAAIQLEKAIEVREGFLYLLQELADRYTTSSMEKDRALRELNALILPFRNASLDVLDGYVRWRDQCHRTHTRQPQTTTPPYLWKGVSYLHKMCSDTYFLIFAKIGQLLDFDLRNNPLLDPRREAEMPTAGGKLPPLRRPKDGSRLADLPKERIEKGERLLQEEAQRQQALAMARAQGGGDAAAYVEEESHLAGLVREEEEKHSLVVEEESWLNAHRREELEKGREEKASVRIQTLYRGYTSRRLVGAKTTQHRAAVKIQTLARQFLAKLQTQRLRKQIRAAKKIQALHRGVTTRSTIDRLRYRQNSALAIQRVYRGHLARRTADMLRFVRRCAIAIQRVYKGFRVRKAVNQFVVTTRWLAAATIQRHWRGYLVRRNPCFNPRKVEKVVKLQAWARGNIDRTLARQLLREKRAAIVLQAWWRGVQGRKDANRRRKAVQSAGWELQLKRAVNAATRIQAAWRRHTAAAFCQQLRSQRETSLAAAAMTAINEEVDSKRAAEASREVAAVKVQATFRGFRTRRDFKMVCVLASVATQIQRVMRGRLGRLRALARRRELLDQLSGVGSVGDDASVVDGSGLPEAAVPTALPVETLVSEQPTQADEEPELPTRPNQANLHPVDQEARLDVAPVEEPVAASNETPPPVTPSGTPAATDIASLPEPPSSAHPDREERSREVVEGEDRHPVQPETNPEFESTPVTEESAVRKKDGESDEQRRELIIAAVRVIANFWRRCSRSRKVSGRENGIGGGMKVRKEAHRQEIAFAVNVLQGWTRARLARMHFQHARTLRRIEIVSRPVRLQEEGWAAAQIQAAVRRHLAKGRQRRPPDHVVRPSCQTCILQEQAVAQQMIAQRWRMAQRRSGQRIRPTQSAADARLAIEQEQRTAARLISGFARRILQRSRKTTPAPETSATPAAILQERIFAAAILRSVLDLVRAKRTTADLRRRRADLVAQCDRQAQEQESLYQTASAERTDDGPTSALSPAVTTSAVLPAPSALNRNHSHRSSHAHFEDSVSEVATSHHKTLPKDAPAGEEIIAEEASESLLQARARVLELEEKLRRLQAEQALRIEEEVRRRIRSPVSSTSTPTQPEASLDAPPEPLPRESTSEPLPAASNEDAEIASRPQSEEPLQAERIVASSLPTEEVGEAAVPPHRPSAEADGPVVEERVAPGAEGETMLPPPGSRSEAEAKVQVEQSEAKGSGTEPAVNAALPQPRPDDSALGADTDEVHTAEVSSPVEVLEVDHQPETRHAAAEVVTETPETTEPRVGQLALVEEPQSAPERPCAEPQPQEAAEPTEIVTESALGVDTRALPPTSPEAAEPQTAGYTEAEAALVIQSACRAHLVRKSVYHLYCQHQRQARQAREAEERREALRIQCAFRQHLAREDVKRRRRTVAEEQRQRQAEAKAQVEAAQREIEQRHMAVAAAARDKTENRAAAVIQRAYKCYDARFMLKWRRMERQERRAQKAAAEEQQMNQESVQRIQSFSRRVAAGQTVREMKKERTQLRERQRNLEERAGDAAVTIQCAWRSSNARFEATCRRRQRHEAEQQLLAKKQAAEEQHLQRIREEEAESLRRLEAEKAGLTMQLAWRSYNARFRKAELLRQKQERDEKEQRLSQSIDLLKRVAGGYLARRGLFKDGLRLRQDGLARAAQPAGRGYMERVQVAQEHNVKQLGRATSEKAIERALESPTRDPEQPEQ